MYACGSGLVLGLTRRMPGRSFRPAGFLGGGLVSRSKFIDLLSMDLVVSPTSQTCSVGYLVVRPASQACLARTWSSAPPCRLARRGNQSSAPPHRLSRWEIYSSVATRKLARQGLLACWAGKGFMGLFRVPRSWVRDKNITITTYVFRKQTHVNIHIVSNKIKTCNIRTMFKQIKLITIRYMIKGRYSYIYSLMMIGRQDNVNIEHCLVLGDNVKRLHDEKTYKPQRRS